MSHFAVLVVTEKDPTENESIISELLFPYHEFECTGYTEYVQTFDITEEAKEIYTTKGYDCFVNATKDIKKPTYDDMFKRKLTRKEKDDAVKYMEKTGETDLFSYIEKNIECKGISNINAIGKTDLRERLKHIRVGYSERQIAEMGYYKKFSTYSEFLTFEDFVEDYYGFEINNVMTKEEKEKAGYYAEYQKDDNDEIELRVFRRTNPNAKWDWWVVGGRWGEYLDGQNTVQKKDFKFDIEKHRTFAILYNGEWIEEGKMGWWAIVTDGKDDNTWKEEYQKVYDSIPEDYYLTVVDCHI